MADLHRPEIHADLSTISSVPSPLPTPVPTPAVHPQFDTLVDILVALLPRLNHHHNDETVNTQLAALRMLQHPVSTAPVPMSSVSEDKGADAD